MPLLPLYIVPYNQNEKKRMCHIIHPLVGPSKLIDFGSTLNIGTTSLAIDIVLCDFKAEELSAITTATDTTIPK